MTTLIEDDYEDVVERVSRQMLGHDHFEIRERLRTAFQIHGIEVDSDNLDVLADNISKGIEQPG